MERTLTYPRGFARRVACGGHYMNMAYHETRHDFTDLGSADLVSRAA